ncbi:MAG TPA: dethiobiotin synthase [Steroidobacteraceae bacterium]|nr:dethiobiotin synthase [Steroidobacteraceae bacterium]
MSRHGYFIAGTDTGVGKTRITVGLLHALATLGVRAVGMKAVASGTDAAGRNEDVALIREANAHALPMGASGSGSGEATVDLRGDHDAVNPYCFPWPISPHLAARRAGVTIEPPQIAAAAEALGAGGALLLVEGTGGWLAPIGPDRTMADVAETLGLPVVLVVGLRLGCLNHALLSAGAIAHGRVPLAGWIGSQIDRQMLAFEDNIATLDARLPAPRLGLLSYSEDASADRVQLAPAAQRLAATALAATAPAATAPAAQAPRARPVQKA